MCKYFTIFLFLIAINLWHSDGRMVARFPMLMSDDGSEIDKESLWACNFNIDDCGIINQHNMAQYRVRNINTDSSAVFGRISMLFLNTSTIGHLPAARLETPYFPTEEFSDACLKMSYLMYGSAVKSMFIIQQDTENSCLWQQDNDPNSVIGDWREVAVTVNLRNGNPRFFIETHFNPMALNHGISAVTDFEFQYGVCKIDHTRICGGGKLPQLPPEQK